MAAGGRHGLQAAGGEVGRGHPFGLAVAYFMSHAKAGTTLLPLLNGGEAAVLFCFVFLYLVFAGPGAWALDNKWCKRAA